MCSTAEERLAELGRAIEELAAAAELDHDEQRRGHAPRPVDPDDQPGPDAIMARLAGLWALLAELDPGIARRMRGYLS